MCKASLLFAPLAARVEAGCSAILHADLTVNMIIFLIQILDVYNKM